MRPFGIELEACGRYPHNATRHSSYRRMTSIEDKEINQLGYRCDTDGSIAGTEFVSPILTSLETVPKLVSLIKRMGFTSGGDNGLHVHVGIDWKKEVWLDRLGFNSYLEEFYNGHKLKLLEQFPIAKRRLSACGNGNINFRKYSAINSSTSYKTLEFRIFNGVLNSRYICRAVCYACAFVDELETWLRLSPNPNPSSVGQLAANQSETLAFHASV